jgi:hypothetical protein
MFVSTALELWWTDRPAMFARDFQINDTVYRRLDPEYFAWLRSRMTLAKGAAIAGRIPLAAFEELRVRFNAIQEWATARLGEGVLLEAVRHLNPRDYVTPVAEEHERRPPVPVRSPMGVEHRRPADVRPEAVAMVDAVRGQALSLGWTDQALYRIPEDRRAGLRLQSGLVCYLREGWRIGDVTCQWIELIGPPPLEVRQRFYNPDAEQPWIRRAR